MEGRLVKVLRAIAYGVGALIAIVGVVALLVYVKSQSVITKVYDVRVEAVPIPGDSASLARGEHLVTAVAKCTDCHAEDLTGSIFYASLPFGIFPASNLTAGQGGIGGEYSDQDWVRAIRHAVHRDGQPLPFMPARSYQWMSDADLGAVIAYVRSRPAANRRWPEPRYGPIARGLIALGKMPFFEAAIVDHAKGRVTAPAPGVTVAYGQYLARIGGCTSCHGEDLAGGIAGQPGSPKSANLTPAGLGAWSEAEFVRVFREGKRPDGRELNDVYMPWRSSGRMTDGELRAIWSYLRSLPSTPMPGE